MSSHDHSHGEEADRDHTEAHRLEVGHDHDHAHDHEHDRNHGDEHADTRGHDPHLGHDHEHEGFDKPKHDHQPEHDPSHGSEAEGAHSHGTESHADHVSHPDGSHAEGHVHSHDGEGWLGAMRDAIPFLHSHSHDIGETAADRVLEDSMDGIRVVAWSLGILAATAAVQLAIAVASGSVGLLADTIHNVADALTAIPLWIAFTLGRRLPNRRYTYGYGRAEDAAGLAVVAIIFISAAVALWESIQKLLHPVPLNHLGFVAIGALAGFAGNEIVASMRIRTGRRIGSAALVADGQHARADGITSLAVLVAVGGSALGWTVVDPIVGIVITAVIVVIGRDAARMMWRRLMDAVEPTMIDDIEATAKSTPGVEDVTNARARWIGHRLIADLNLVVDGNLTVAQGHEIAEDVHHRLLHKIARLSGAAVHVDPSLAVEADPHRLTAHHR